MVKPSIENAASFTVEVYPPKLGELNGDFNDLFAHWVDIKGDKFAPTWRDFDWQKISTKLVPWIAIADVSYEPLDFTYRFWGTARSENQGKDYTGKSVRDFRPISISEKAMKEYGQIAEEKVPLHYITNGLTNFINKPFSYHSLRLPFSYDGRQVDNILGVGLYNTETAGYAADFYGTRKK